MGVQTGAEEDAGRIEGVQNSGARPPVVFDIHQLSLTFQFGQFFSPSQQWRDPKCPQRFDDRCRWHSASPSRKAAASGVGISSVLNEDLLYSGIGGTKDFCHDSHWSISVSSFCHLR